jgi:hypothetical protein
MDIIQTDQGTHYDWDVRLGEYPQHIRLIDPYNRNAEVHFLQVGIIPSNFIYGFICIRKYVANWELCCHPVSAPFAKTGQ